MNGVSSYLTVYLHTFRSANPMIERAFSSLKVFKRIKRIKEEMQKSNPSMWQIHYAAWTDSGFWFVYPDYGFGPEMELLEWLERKPEKGILYITKTYDYHC